MLGIVANYHPMQLQGKLMIQTQNNDKKSNFGPDLGLLGINSPKKNVVSFTTPSNQTKFQAIMPCNLKEN